MNKTLYIIFICLFSTAGTVFSQFSNTGSSGPEKPVLVLSLDQDSYSAGEKAILTVKYIFPDNYHQTYDPVNFRLEGIKADDVIYGSTIYPDGETDEYGNIQYYNDADLRLEIKIDQDIETQSVTGEVKAYYQLCDENGICYFPDSQNISYTIDVKPAGSVEGGLPALGIIMIMAFLGGFLLNLMPCVLPLLSVKAMNLIHQSGEERSVLIRHGLLYTAGIIFSFLILSLIIIILQQSGKLLGWGFQFQSPVFLTILISVIFLFALSLFEVFIILPPSSGMNKADSYSRKKGYTGSFFTGIFAVFVATPCTAPFLGTAMGFAFAQSGMIVLLIMSLTGLGLSLPFLLLGFYPGFFRLLPKPGKWMDKFREAMAFLLLGTVAYLSTTLIHQIGRQFINVIWFLLILAFSAWIWGWSMKSSRKKAWRWLFLLLPVILIISSGFLILDFSPIEKGTSEIMEESYWENFDSDRAEEYINQGQPLLIAFSADWCTSCKINEKTVFNTEKTKSLFRIKKLKTVKADLTLSNPEAMDWIYRYDRAGVPLYLLFLPGQEVMVLPEILSYGIFEEVLSTLPGNI